MLHDSDDTPATSASVLLVDLNNHARYPTLPVGLITAVLRGAGHQVELFSPLAVGVSGPPRDQRARPWSYWDERVRWWSAITTTPGVQRARRWLGRRRQPGMGAEQARIAEGFARALAARPHVVLISAYYIYEDVVRDLVSRCGFAGIPVIVGGPGFTSDAAAQAWLGLKGLTALVAGECEPFIDELVRRASRGADLHGLPGVSVPGRALAPPAPPLGDLDALPIPDYDDFPWERYPSRVITILTGRGCGWGVCTFCSDVLTANGRTFRTRSAENVLAELRHHHERYGVKLFHFSDLKLNSDLALWRGLCAGFQAAAPGAQWTCSVHAGGKGDQGLGLADLEAARAAGLTRVTTGVETGSQRLLDQMRKGVRVEALSAFLKDAHRAGISVRVSMFTGYPGEEPADLDASAAFVEAHATELDRVHLSRFLILPGTPIAQQIEAERERFPELQVSFGPARVDSIPHADHRIDGKPYRRALHRLLRAVHGVNRAPLPDFARALEGVM
ncbi:MAG: radical SAM protein [Planctomycetota bacterium]